MTAKSFAEFIEQAQPIEIRASHYALAPDVYGLDDGYAWAFATVSRGEALTNADAPTDATDPATGLPAANASTYNARHHLTDGGEWPYLIAATPSPVSSRADEYTLATRPENRTPEMLAALTEHRVLETYCEGDLVAYIFEDRSDRDTAVERWKEDREELTARILAEEYSYEDADRLAPAVLAEATDGYGSSLDGDELRDRIVEVMEDSYAGEWRSLAEYVQGWHEGVVPREDRESMGELWNYVDWERMASDWETDHTAHPAGGGNVYVFRAF